MAAVAAEEASDEKGRTRRRRYFLQRTCVVDGKAAGFTLGVALAICMSLALVVLCSKVVGCVMPMVADKLGLDPALMASPLITTVMDTLSLLIYFNVAKAILGI